MARVSLKGLGHSFGAEKIIDHVDLEIEDGEFLTLLGPSGCGKTTTLRIVAGFLLADAGHVHFDGKDMTRVPTQHRKLGMVFQDYALFPHLSVARNVGFALQGIGMSKTEIDTRVRELLELIRLPAVADRLPVELSGGQQQRVAIARALAHTPSVLLMDEPLGALDLKLREAMQNELHSIQRQMGITTIYVTHDQEEALSLSHRIALMRHGRIEQLDTPKTIYSKPKTPFSAFFLGKVNFLQGKVVQRSGNHYEVMVAGDIQRCPVPDLGLEFPAHSDVVLGIRPESMRITNEAPTPEMNSLRGRIVREKFIGKVVQFDIEVGDGSSIVVDGSLAQAKEIGANVHVTWDAQSTHIYPFQEDTELGIFKLAGSVGKPAITTVRSTPATSSLASAITGQRSLVSLD